MENLALIILAENICKNLLKELENDNKKNVIPVLEFLNSIDLKYALSAFRIGINIRNSIFYDIPDYNEFINLNNKLNNALLDKDTYNEFQILYLKRKLINNPGLKEVKWPVYHTSFLAPNKNIIVTRLENNEFKVVIEE